MADIERDCFQCRYYLCEEYTCMKLWRAKSVFDEWVTAKACNYFTIGAYDEDMIEKEYWESQQAKTIMTHSEESDRSG